jgi:hypothetical protein
MRRIQISLAAVVIALAVCVPAYASGNSALRSAYGSTPHNVGAVVAKTTKPKAKPVVKPAKPVATVRSTGTLPFTGMDLGVGAAAAVALIGAGLAFRRLGRQPS